MTTKKTSLIPAGLLALVAALALHPADAVRPATSPRDQGEHPARSVPSEITGFRRDAVEPLPPAARTKDRRS